MYKAVFVPVLLSLTVASTVSAHHQATTAAGKPLVWCQPVLEYTVDAQSERELGPDGMDALRRAGSAWLGLQGVPSISIASASAGSKSPWRIEWVSDWRDTWNADSELAVTTSGYWSDGVMTNSVVTINGEKPWSFDEAGPSQSLYDFETTMAHEFGHVLGLAHVEGAADSVMVPAVAMGQMIREPADVDMDAVEDTYSRRRSCVTILQSAPSCSATNVRHAMGGNHPMLMLVCGIALTLLLRMWNRTPRI